MCPADHPRSRCLNQTPPSSERISHKTPLAFSSFFERHLNFFKKMGLFSKGWTRGGQTSLILPVLVAIRPLEKADTVRPIVLEQREHQERSLGAGEGGYGGRRRCCHGGSPPEGQDCDPPGAHRAGNIFASSCMKHSPDTVAIFLSHDYVHRPTAILPRRERTSSCPLEITRFNFVHPAFSSSPCMARKWKNWSFIVAHPGILVCHLYCNA
jgi:hypothetical protein